MSNNFVEQLYRQNHDINQENIYQPQTEMGKKLWEISSRSLTKQSKLLTLDEINEEISESRGESVTHRQIYNFSVGYADANPPYWTVSTKIVY